MIFHSFEVGDTDYVEALGLREDILRKPLGLSLTEGELAHDVDCFHLGGFDGMQLVAVLLLQPLDKRTLQMRQVAVRAALQRTGVGSRFITFAEEFARQRGYSTMIAHARGTALGFYLRLGYAAVGDDFLEQTIPHRLVTKSL